MKTTCAKCSRPRAHPKAAYCDEHRREYNRRHYAEQHTPEEQREARLVLGLQEHIAKGGKCAEYKHYWDMTGREVGLALGWYESKGSQSLSSQLAGISA